MPISCIIEKMLVVCTAGYKCVIKFKPQDIYVYTDNQITFLLGTPRPLAAFDTISRTCVLNVKFKITPRIRKKVHNTGDY